MLMLMAKRNSYRKTTEDIDRLINCFVEQVNMSHREPVSVDESPASVLVGVPDDCGNSDWLIKPYSDTYWITDLEKQLNMSLPYALRSLVSRYIFPAFDALGICFFANTPEGMDRHEFRTKLFDDQALCPMLLAHRYLRFAQPDLYNYDPICIDMNHGSGIDGAIVRIDHEDILCFDKLTVTEVIAPSLVSLLTR